MDRWGRRQFVQGAGATGLALLAGCGRLPGQAPPSKVARIGWLGPGNGSDPNFEAFRQGLREFGYVEGQNVVIEARWAAGRFERYPALAAELVGLQPDVLVTTSTPPTLAAQQATSTIPIVFTSSGDPVGLGLVASLARPGGNITGLSNLFVPLGRKRLELLKETVPSAARVAGLWNPTNPANALEWSATQEAARTLGVEAQSVAVRTTSDLASALDTILDERADALVILADPLLSVTNTPQIPDFIARTRLPTMTTVGANVEAGGLMYYGPSLTGMCRRAAYYVDRILRGAKPAELPVEQPTTFDFAINLKTAQALGLTIPQHVLLQATEVIQ
jgi:putative ABC transport system substrate-binding protein